MKMNKPIRFDPISVFFMLIYYQATSVLIALMLCAGFAPLLAFVFGVSGPGSLAEVGATAMVGLLFFPMAIFFSFNLGGPALLIGYVASLYLLNSGELRRWVWVCTLGGIGLLWAFMPIYILPSATFGTILNTFSIASFLTATLCGFRMADYVRELADSELQALQPERQYDFNFHVRVLMNIASAFGLIVIALIVFVPLGIGIFKDIMGSRPDFYHVQNLFDRDLKLVPVFILHAFGLGLGAIAAAYLLTVRLLRRNEQRAWVWIASYGAIGLFPGWLPGLAFVPGLFLKAHILTPVSVVFALVVGALMWVFARHLKESLPGSMVEPVAETEKGVMT